jgi:hypothetical protein
MKWLNGGAKRQCDRTPPEILQPRPVALLLRRLRGPLVLRRAAAALLRGCCCCSSCQLLLQLRLRGLPHLVALHLLELLQTCQQLRRRLFQLRLQRLLRLHLLLLLHLQMDGLCSWVLHLRLLHLRLHLLHLLQLRLLRLLRPDRRHSLALPTRGPHCHHE